jgi:hypothetical protein
VLPDEFLELTEIGGVECITADALYTSMIWTQPRVECQAVADDKDAAIQDFEKELNECERGFRGSKGRSTFSL